MANRMLGLLALMLIFSVGFCAGVPPAVNIPIISSPSAGQTVTSYRYDTQIPFVFTVESAVNTSFSCKLVSYQNSAWGEYGINASTLNATATTLYLNRTIMPDLIYSLTGVKVGVNCTVNTAVNTSAVRTFNLKLNRGMAETVTDLGEGFASFMRLSKDPIGNFVLWLGVTFGVCSIVYCVVLAIKGAFGLKR